MAVDKINIDINSSKTKKQMLPHNKRVIFNFSELEKKINLMTWDEDVKKAFLKKAKKYPEAALDYIWNNLNNFLLLATKDVSGRNTNRVRAEKPKEEEIIKPSFLENGVIDDQGIE